MTIEELKCSKEPFMLVKDAARILHIAPQSLRELARNNPDALGFQVFTQGRRVYIFRKSFLTWIGEGCA